MNCRLCIELADVAPFSIYDDANVLVRLDSAPLSRGHAVAVLRVHRADITDPHLSSAEHATLLDVIQRVARAMTSQLGCERVYVITMSDVVQHLHYHLVPRYPGEARGFPFWTEKGAMAAAEKSDLNEERRRDLEQLASELRRAIAVERRR